MKKIADEIREAQVEALELRTRTIVADQVRTRGTIMLDGVISANATDAYLAENWQEVEGVLYHRDGDGAFGLGTPDGPVGLGGPHDIVHLLIRKPAPKPSVIETARAVVATGKPVIDANNAQNASFDAFVEALAGLDAALDREET